MQLVLHQVAKPTIYSAVVGKLQANVTQGFRMKSSSNTNSGSVGSTLPTKENMSVGIACYVRNEPD